LNQAAKREFSGNILNIDPDEQRGYHPEAKKYQSKTPYSWSGRTHHDAKLWTDELRDKFIEGRRNFIVDGTLAGPDPIITQIRNLPAGYQTEIRVVATHKLESEWGVDRRFTDQLVKEGYGRYVPGDFRDFAYDNLPKSLDKIHDQTGTRIRIFDREGKQLYDSRASPVKPGAALEQAREVRMQDPAVTRRTTQGWREQADAQRHGYRKHYTDKKKKDVLRSQSSRNESYTMNQTIDPIKLKAAAEHLEWVLKQYPNEAVVQDLLQSLLPLIEAAKAGQVLVPMDRRDIPGGYFLGDGVYIPYTSPSIEDAYGNFVTEAEGGLNEDEKKFLTEMVARYKIMHGKKL
jgi:hypothetical protein